MNGTQTKMHTCTQTDRQTYLQCNKGEVELFCQMKVTHPSIPSFSLSLLIPRTTDSQPQPCLRKLGPYSFLPLPFPSPPLPSRSSELLTHNLSLVPQGWAPTHSSLPLSFPYSPFICSSSEVLIHSLRFVPQCWVAHTFRWASGEL